MEQIKYGGKWNIIDVEREFDGELFIDDVKGIINLTIWYISEKPFGDGIIPFKPFIVNGTLLTGVKITLIGGRVIYQHSNGFYNNTRVIQFKYAMENKCFNQSKEIVFNQVKFTISKMLSWSGLSGFDTPNIEGYIHTVAYRAKKPIIDMLDDNVEIEFSCNINSYNLNKMVSKMEISQSTDITIKHSKPSTIEYNLELIDKILRLIAFSIGERPEIIKIEGTSDDNFDMLGGEKIHRYSRIFMNNKYEADYIEPLGYDNLFSLQDLIEQEEGFLNRWIQKYELISPVIELYLSEMYNYGDMSMERYFLNLVQALEAYHMRFKYNTVEDFKVHIKNITQEHVGGKKYYEALFPRYVYQTKKSNYIVLSSRLLDLFVADWDIWFYFSSFEEIEEFVKKVVNTRNYHTHYDVRLKSNILNGIDLNEACYVLKTVLEYYILSEIGISNEKIHQQINERKVKIREWFGIERFNK